MLANGRASHQGEAERKIAAQRARGLARLLQYAVLDAKDLEQSETAQTVQQAIDQLKRQFALTDQEIMQS